MAGLRTDGHCGNFFPVYLDRIECWLRCDIIIPKIVMDCLKLPDELPRVTPHRHHGVRVPVIARPLAAVIVRTRAARRNEDEVSLFINRNDGPRVPGARPDTLCRRNGIPCPPQGAGPYIERPDLTAGGLHTVVVCDCRTNHHKIADNRGRGS